MKLSALKSFFALTFISAQAATALTVTSVTSDNGLPAYSVQWTDSAGLPRTAILVKQSNSGAYQGPGYLRRLTYRVGGVDRVCTGTDTINGGTDEFSGDGFVQNHTGDGGDYSNANSPLVPGTTEVTLSGTSHAIITFNTPTYQINGSTVPTTVQWFFADGRSHPTFAISQDARALPGNLGGDSRSPYGDMAYDGDGVNAHVGGASYGDTYKFVTLTTNDVTTNSGWKDVEVNTIPYAMQWANPNTIDAEMGHVATVPITVYDQGSDSRLYPAIDPRNTTHAAGPMLTDESWAYQILNYQWPSGAATAITSKRLTWGRNFGSIGGFDNYGDTSVNIKEYSQHSTDPLGVALTGDRADGTLLAYSVFVVLGTHTGAYTNGTVGKQVVQMENVTHASLTATSGTVLTNGPAGAGNATNRSVTFSPAGYNPAYSTWEIAATTNSANATLAASATYPLDHPVLVVNNYASSQLPSSISVGAGLTNAEVDYFASVDTNAHRLWVTVNRTVTASANLIIGAWTPGPAISAIPASSAVGSPVVITGQYFTGAMAVTFNGIPAASFTVDSDTQITATVPNGATSGFIVVTTPDGATVSIMELSIPVTGGGGGGGGVSLVITTSGQGAVSPNLNGKTVVSNRLYTLTATAKLGNVFSNWTGSIVTNKNPLSFHLTSNVVLQANFVTNPFLATKGIYNGLFSGSNGVTEDTAGMLRGLNVGQKGTYTGALLIGGKTHGISGSFNLAGVTTNHSSAFTVEMTLNNTNAGPQIIGTVSAGGWSANLTAYRATNAIPSAEATVVMAPTNSSVGYGYALITNHIGAAHITGALGDGTAFNETVGVAADGSVPVYANLYAGKGLLLGWINLNPTNLSSTGVTWIHPVTTHGFYQSGFTNRLTNSQVLLSPWTNASSNIFLLTNLALLGTSTPIAINSKGKLTGSNIVGTVNLKTGLVKFTDGIGSKKISGSGAILLNGPFGAGYFLTKTNAQGFLLQSQLPP